MHNIGQVKHTAPSAVCHLSLMLVHISFDAQKLTETIAVNNDAKSLVMSDSCDCGRVADDLAEGLRGSSEGRPGASSVDAPASHGQLAGRIGEGPMGSLEAHLEVAERIADAVAARLSHRATHAAAESLQPAQNTLQQLPDPPAHTSAGALLAQPEEPAAVFKRQLQMPAGVPDSNKAEPSLQGMAGGHLLQQSCEQGASAEVHPGSPFRSGGSGQPKGAEGCAGDFLAALLLGTSGPCSGQLRHAASPGLMHRQACSHKSSSAESRGSASPPPEPWTAHWVGKLTQQQMQNAIQEVMLHHLVPAAQLVKPCKAFWCACGLPLLVPQGHVAQSLVLHKMNQVVLAERLHGDPSLDDSADGSCPYRS